MGVEPKHNATAPLASDVAATTMGNVWDATHGMGADDPVLLANQDTSDNELHAGVGGICPRCGRVIRSSDPVRRNVSGAYQHDAC